MNGTSQKNVDNTNTQPETAHQLIRQVKRLGRRRISAEDKIRIVMQGLRGEESVSDLCRKKRLQGDQVRDATSGDVRDLRRSNEDLKLLVAELTLENRRLKKSHMPE